MLPYSHNYPILGGRQESAFSGAPRQTIINRFFAVKVGVV